MKKFLKKIKIGINKIMKIITNNKRVSIGVLCGVLVIILAIGLTISFLGKGEEKKLTRQLETLGRSWYDDYFYDAIDQDKEEFLKRFHETGLKIDLYNLSLRAVDGIEEDIKQFENKNCDKNETKVIIYPHEPYGKEDYKIETVMKCADFKNKK